MVSAKIDEQVTNLVMVMCYQMLGVSDGFDYSLGMFMPGI
jgi:hypothetical protein